QIFLEEIFQSSSSRLLDSEGAGDRRQYQLGLSRLCECNEADAVCKLLENLSRGLEAKPRLADTARTGHRQHANVWLSEHLHQVGELALTADQGGRLGRQVRRSAVESLERRELVLELSGSQLEEPLRRRQILEPVRPEIAKRELLGQLALDERPSRLGDEHLPAVPRGPDPGGAVNVEAG